MARSSAGTRPRRMQDRRNVEHFVDDRRAREGDQAGEQRQQELIDVAGVEDGGPAERRAMREERRNGAEQRADPMPVACRRS